MALTEHQIARYARHILLPEVGGVGQERLLAAEVRLTGEAMFVELAGDYLSAAGVGVDAHSGTGLALQLRGGPGVCVRATGDELRVFSSACEACLGEGSGPLPLESGSIAASLAASELLRLILGLDEANRSWRVRGANVEAIPFVPCPAHGGAA